MGERFAGVVSAGGVGAVGRWLELGPAVTNFTTKSCPLPGNNWSCRLIDEKLSQAPPGLAIGLIPFSAARGS